MKNSIDLLENMTIKQKAIFCAGGGLWRTACFKEEELESVTVAQAQNGLVKAGGESAYLHAEKHETSTCFPSAGGLACSWNGALVRSVGEAVGEDARKQRIDAVIIPSAGVKRSMTNGRAAAYYSEDPFLCASMCKAYAKGVDSRGAGVIIEGFGVEDRQRLRFFNNSVIDRRAFAENYLKGFADVVQSVDVCGLIYTPGYLNADKIQYTNSLEKDTYFKKAGFKGVFLSPWFCAGNPVKAIKSGIIPEFTQHPQANARLILNAIESGEITESNLDEVITKTVRLSNSIQAKKEKIYMHDSELNHNMAKYAAKECIVLLKNDNALPISRSEKILVVGKFAKQPRIQLSGRTYVKTDRIVSAFDTLEKYAAFDYIEDYDVSSEFISGCDTVIVFAGIDGKYEAEGIDRTSLRLPEEQNRFIEHTAKTGKKVIVAVTCGGPVEMPWAESVGAILYDPICGECSGEVTAEIIYGDVNPSAKLAQTFPLSYDDSPLSVYDDGSDTNIVFREHIYNGYKYFASTGKNVLFPFGYGLSYSLFSYGDFSVTGMDKNGEAEISLTVRNDSEKDGYETVQIYISDAAPRVVKPKMQLAAYEKVFVKARETKRVGITLAKDAFSHYNTDKEDFVSYSTDYEIHIGASSNDIKYTKKLTILTDHIYEREYDTSEVPTYFALQPSTLFLPNIEYLALYGSKLPFMYLDKNYGLHTPLYELDRIRSMSRFIRAFKSKVGIADSGEEIYTEQSEPNLFSIDAVFGDLPLKALPYYYPEIYSPKVDEKIMKILERENIRTI